MALAAPLAPMAQAVTLLKGPLVEGQGMADGGEQGEQLGRAAVLHRGAREQPGGPQARVAAQPQKGARALAAEVLGVVGLIGDQHRAGLGEVGGELGPAQQLQPQLQGGGLLPPMGMQAAGGKDHDAAACRTHHGPGRHQGGEGFAEPHGVSQQGAAAGQQPTHGGALVGEQLPPIGKRLGEIRRGHQLPVGGQRGQRLLQPGEPLG